MLEYVFRENICHFKKALATEADHSKREVLKKLLAEETAKLAKYLTEQAMTSEAPAESPRSSGLPASLRAVILLMLAYYPTTVISNGVF